MTTTPPAPVHGPSPRPPRRLTARTPEDVLALVPVVLGFEPERSVVMLTFGGRDTFHGRLDLPPPGADEATIDAGVRMLLDPARHHRVHRVLFVVYGDDDTTSRRTVRALRRSFTCAGIEVVEVLRTQHGRWFAPGAPRHGVPYRVDDHRFRAQAVLDGIVIHGSRADIELSLRPVADLVDRTRDALATAGVASADEVADLVAMRLRTGRFTDGELARVLLATTGAAGGPGRDACWTGLGRDQAESAVRLWTDAVQRSPEELVDAPAAVLAWCAWLAGHGALAWCAVDRCREVRPDHPLAEVVDELLTRAVPPATWVELVETLSCPGPAAGGPG
jgi:hypothetical protein